MESDRAVPRAIRSHAVHNEGVPPTYRHVGRLFHFDSSGNRQDTTESLAKAPFMDFDETPTMTEAQFDRLRAQLLAARVQRLGGQGAEEGLLPSFGDHKLIRYIQHVAARADLTPTNEATGAE